MKQKIVTLVFILFMFMNMLAQTQLGTPQGITISYQVTSAGSVKVLNHGMSKLCQSMVVDGVVQAKPVERIHFSVGKHVVTCIMKDTTQIPKNFVKGIDALLSVNIPPSVKTIKDYAFSNCKGLIEVQIPNSVTTIGEYAFENCAELNKVSLSPNLVEIKAGTFSGCKKLTQIEIPHYVQKIGDFAFYECEGMEELVFPNDVEEIGESAFRGCIGLQKIELPNAMLKIGESAFEGCSNVITINIPGGIEQIGFCAIRYCTSLYQINYGGTIVDWKNIEPTSWKEINSRDIPVHCTNGDTEFHIDDADKRADI